MRKKGIERGRAEKGTGNKDAATLVCESFVPVFQRKRPPRQYAQPPRSIRSAVLKQIDSEASPYPLEFPLRAGRGPLANDLRRPGSMVAGGEVELFADWVCYLTGLHGGYSF